MASARGATPEGQSAVSASAAHCASACCPLPESTIVTRSAVADAIRTSRNLAPLSTQTVPSPTGTVFHEKATRGVLATGATLRVAPGVAFATKVCQPEAERHGRTTMLGVLRMMERIGSVAGPAAAAAIAVSIGFGPAIGAIGALVVVVSLAHGLIALAVPVLRDVRRDSIDAELRGAE